MSAVVIDLCAWRRDHPRRARRDMPLNPMLLAADLVRLQMALWSAGVAAFWLAQSSFFRGGQP